MDLRDLADMGDGDLRPMRVLAPYRPGDAALQAEVTRLRAGGIIVVVELPGHEANRAELGCEQQLVSRAGTWKLEPLK
jgi:ATP phosphoribosyltransferase regulatory subunit